MQKQLNNSLRFGLITAGILLSTLVQADCGKIVLAVGGGFSSISDAKFSKTFPILNEVTDEYFIYHSNSNSATKGLFEAFLAYEGKFSNNWQIQAGLAYDQISDFAAHGSFIQGADEQSENLFNYNFTARARQLLAQVKIMNCWCNKFYPYLLAGIGAGFNYSENYSTDVPPFLTFTRMYQDNHATSFAYRVGVGFDYGFCKNVRLGIGYRFAGLGKFSLGTATIDDIPVDGTLSKSNVYANEVLLQLTMLA